MVVLGLLIGVRPSSDVVDQVSQISVIAAELAAAGWCARVALATRRAARLSWGLFALALALWGLTDAAAWILDMAGVTVAEVSPLDAGWLSFYVPMLAGLSVAYARLRPERGWQGALDGAVFAIAVGLFGWAFALHGIAAAGAGGATGTAVNLLYPSFDLLCVAIVAWLLVRLRGAAPGWLWLIGAAVALQALGDLVYLVVTVHDGDAGASLSPLWFAAGGWLWALAARARLRHPARVWPAPAQSSPPVWSRALPFVLALAMFVLLIPRDPVVGGVAMVGVVLAIARVVSTLSINQRLIEERERLLVADPLTGALNRRFFDEDLRARIAEGAVSLIAVDLDNFKQLNDRHGHAVGDELLCAVVEAMRTAVRASDVVCRLGGDEFAVIARGADGADAAEIAERVRAAVWQAAEKTQPGCDVSASLGIAVAVPGEDDADDLARRADEALYAAKAAGRNRVRVEEPLRAAGALA